MRIRSIPSSFAVSKRSAFILLGAVAFVLLPFVPLHANVALNGIFSDSMVLQREAKVPVWGTAAPGEKVTVEFVGQKVETEANPSGGWRVELSGLKPGGPFALTVTGSNRVEIKDVLVGDVWLCSGQSNMALKMGGFKDPSSPYHSDVESAQFPLIRQGMVPGKPSLDPLASTDVKWAACTPESVLNFTAAGFYFAREIHKETGVPIGLILAAWGGTSAESWTSIDALNTVPGFKQRAESQITNLNKLPEQIKAFPGLLAAWEKANGRGDTGNEGEAAGWAKPGAPADDWKPGHLTARWKSSGFPNGGIVWFRKEINLPATAVGKPIRLNLGSLSEVCLTAYFNGEKVADWGQKPPNFYTGYFAFTIPEKLVKEGGNTFAFRVVANTGNGTVCKSDFKSIGFGAAGMTEDGDDCLTRVEKEYPPLAANALKALPPSPSGDAAHTSSALFGGMIHPLIPFAIKGALWYQGEQDGSRGYAYRTLLPLMIRDWRQRWGQGDFPFLIQQLPNWNAAGADQTGWAEVREAQWLTARTLPNCLMSVGIDIGEAGNVHPANKREVGRRLALVALANCYGKPVGFTGPSYQSMRVEVDKIRLEFKDAEGLKTMDGQPLKGFAIAGSDQNLVPAEATIDGTTVIVSSPQVKAPVAVRYAFVNNPTGCNLTNATGLPAVPFRTDEWPVGSQNRQ